MLGTMYFFCNSICKSYHQFFVQRYLSILVTFSTTIVNNGYKYRTNIVWNEYLKTRTINSRHKTSWNTKKQTVYRITHSHPFAIIKLCRLLLLQANWIWRNMLYCWKIFKHCCLYEWIISPVLYYKILHHILFWYIDYPLLFYYVLYLSYDLSLDMVTLSIHRVAIVLLVEN